MLKYKKMFFNLNNFKNVKHANKRVQNKIYDFLWSILIIFNSFMGIIPFSNFNILDILLIEISQIFLNTLMFCLYF